MRAAAVLFILLAGLAAVGVSLLIFRPPGGGGMELLRRFLEVVDKPDELEKFIVEADAKISKEVFETARAKSAKVSLDDEWTAGVEFAAAYFKHSKAGRFSPREQDYLKDKDIFLKALDRTRGKTYQFSAVASPEINAFSLPGGNVFFHSGLLNKIENRQQFLFILGHEIAHVELGHCKQKLGILTEAYEFGGIPAAGAADLIISFVELGFSEENEFAADEWSFRRMKAAGWSADELTAGLVLLDKLIPEAPRAVTNDKSTLERWRAFICNILELHMRSHPATKERIRRLRAIPR